MEPRAQTARASSVPERKPTLASWCNWMVVSTSTHHGRPSHEEPVEAAAEVGVKNAPRSLETHRTVSTGSHRPYRSFKRGPLYFAKDGDISISR